MRAGQPPKDNSSELALSLNDIASNSSYTSSPYSPMYAFDITAQLRTPSNDGTTLAVSARYTLNGAYPVDVQLGRLDHSQGNVLLEIHASFACNGVIAN